MSDIVERLRLGCRGMGVRNPDNYIACVTVAEAWKAADEIERLRAENAKLLEALADLVSEGEMQMGDDRSQHYVEVTKKAVRKGRKALSAPLPEPPR